MRSPRITTKSSPHSPQLVKACVQQQRPNAANNKLINKFLKKNPYYFKVHPQVIPPNNQVLDNLSLL